jgi:hypothetical protein
VDSFPFHSHTATYFNIVQDREPAKRVKSSADPIQKKLNGVHMMNKERLEKEVSTSILVQILIQEATDNANLVSPFTP